MVIGDQNIIRAQEIDCCCCCNVLLYSTLELAKAIFTTHHNRINQYLTVLVCWFFNEVIAEEHAINGIKVCCRVKGRGRDAIDRGPKKCTIILHAAIDYLVLSIGGTIWDNVITHVTSS